MFVGTVIYSIGAASSTDGRRFGWGQRWAIAECVRVALSDAHETPTSRVLTIATKMVRRKNPNLQAFVSFADTRQGHHGGIYQAAGWTYTGDYDSSGDTYIVGGKEVHAKTLHTRYGRGGQSIPWLRAHIDPEARREQRPPKHRYMLGITNEAKQKIAALAKPYPKRAGSADGGTSPVQGEGGGPNPTPALQIEG